MAFRLKIEGYDLVVFEDGAPETEYISNPTAVTVAKFTDATHVQFYDYSQKIDGGRDPFLLGEENNSFVITSLIDNTTGIAFTSVASFKTFIRGKIGYFSSCSSGGSGVQSVTGDGVDNTDPLNPILSFPDADEVDDTSTDNKFVQKLYVNLDSADTSVTRTTAGGRTIFTITHNFNTKDVFDRVYRLSDDRRINWRIETPTVNTLEASRAGSVADGLFRILIIT